MQLGKLAIGLISAIATISTTQFVAFSQQQPHNSQTATIAQATNSQTTKFKVRIENISTKDEFTSSNGMKWSLDFSPGVWLVHKNDDPIFTMAQKDRGQGLEAIAEDGNPMMLAKSLENQSGIQSRGIFNTPVGAIKPKGIRPGQVFEFTFNATPGEKLSLTTMFGQSNDWFYAPKGSGIALFDANGKAISGDITSQILLWNDGTEVDEEPGIGKNQGPRQKSPNTGANENGVVQMVKDNSAYAQTSKVMRVTIIPEG
jgi:hypothetical protein